jgi:hypothetical protein
LAALAAFWEPTMMLPATALASPLVRDAEGCDALRRVA